MCITIIQPRCLLYDHAKNKINYMAGMLMNKQLQAIHAFVAK